ncbi:hypothetical protein UFOVP583_42 [uncultured Caudovirales phage]|uniref:Uncharacterized protein n=1 Tax=uncultured Caudovirales phage TaxID=2100421 RepID=A0A6J5MZD0_9CAUD|nr:hypothetical protein UFOVP583_42 [uncultured Caudovirales phage]
MLAGCASSPSLPKQPDAPTSESVVSTVGKEWDKADQKVAAAVTIARENAEKPEVVKAETTVALSYLPQASPEELALARQRAGKADQKDYAEAVAFGKNLLAKIDADWAKMEADQVEAKRVSQLKDARIADLTKQVEQAKKDAAQNIWTITGAALVVIGGLCCAFASVRAGVTIILTGMLCGAVPFIIESEYFGIIAGSTLAIGAGLGIWWLWDKVRDSVHSNDDQTPPKE